MTGRHDRDCDCGVPALGDLLDETLDELVAAEMASDREAHAAHLRQRRADRAAVRAAMAESRSYGLRARRAAKLRRLRGGDA